MNSRDIIDEKLGFIFDVLTKEMAKNHIGLPIYLIDQKYSITDGVTYCNVLFDLQGNIDSEEIDIIHKFSREYKLLHEYLYFTKKTEPHHIYAQNMITTWPGKVRNELWICVSDEYTDEIEDFMTLLKIKGYHKNTHILQFEQGMKAWL